MSRMQREKGKRIEREACAMLGRIGFDARRRSQSDGKLDPDIVFAQHPDWYCEVKGVRDVLPHHQTAQEWVAKAVSDCREAGCACPFVLTKVHGTSTWAMGWVGAEGVIVWTVGEARIAQVLRGWA